MGLARDYHKLAKPTQVTGKGLMDTGTGLGSDLTTCEKPAPQVQVVWVYTGFTPKVLPPKRFKKVSFYYMMSSTVFAVVKYTMCLPFK
jgi:hypothetical protein